MRLTHLEITHLRNLDHTNINTDATYNIFYGNNGSGKTSVLEAIHLLALGRSFRTHKPEKIIHVDQDQVTVFGHVVSKNQQRLPMGISRDRSGHCQRQIAHNPVHSNAELAQVLPLQLINTQAHFELSNSPKSRRQILDWGMFHVEHSFLSVWQDYHRLLKQRNTLLRATNAWHSDQQHTWDQILADTGEKLTAHRQTYLDALNPIFSDIWAELMPNTPIELQHAWGWSKKETLRQHLIKRQSDDQRIGYTAYGPHRADLRFLIKDQSAFEVLSQGQQKLLLYAVRMAQGASLQQLSDKRCIFLMDDLPAELDSHKRRSVSQVLRRLKAQVFVTGILKRDLTAFTEHTASCLFHINEGQIRPVSKPTTVD